MASRARVQRGHETETAVAQWFAANGWPYAEPVGAGRGGSDVTGMPGLLVEVKARRDFRPVEWLKQHVMVELLGKLDAGPAPLPFVVWRPDGMGPAQAGSWGVMMRLDDFTSLLHEAGYGTEQPAFCPECRAVLVPGHETDRDYHYPGCSQVTED